MPNQASIWRAKVAAQTGTERPVLSRVRNGLTVSLGGGLERMMRSVGPIHRYDGTEIDTDWENSSGGWLAQGKSLDFDIRVGSAGTRRLIPRPDRPGEYLEIGRPQWDAGSGFVNVPFSTASRSGSRWTLTGPSYTLTLVIKPNGIRSVWIINSPSLVRPFRWPLTLSGLTYQDNTLVSQSDGKTVLWLGLPIWRDSSKPPLFGKMNFSWDGQYLTYTVTIPETATYPVELDPDFGTAISASADDGLVYAGSLFDATSAFIGVGEVSNVRNAWLRFVNITIPKGIMVSIAHLDLRSTADSSGTGTVYTNIYLVDEDDHVAPTSYDEWNIDHGVHTSAYAPWDFAIVDANNTAMQSADFSEACEEVFARDGWASGQDIGVHIDDDGSSSNLQFWASIDNSSYTEPELDIVYSTAGAGEGWGLFI